MLLAEKKQTTRDAILDATDRLMARFGFRKMSMDDIAKEARVSKRTIYGYFSGKEEVGLSSIGRVVEGAQETLRSISNSDLDQEEKLEQMLVERVMRRVNAVQDYYQSLDELFEIVRPSYMKQRRLYFETEAGLIAGVLAEGYVDPPSETATTLLLATNAFLPYSLSVRELGEPEQIRAGLTAMVSLLLKGLTKKPKETEQ